MQVDYLIIGQGISGTWLSYYLEKEGKTFLVIDNASNNSSSRIAAGIINPVTGRRHVEVWMAGEILPFALEAYRQIGAELDTRAVSQKNVIDFFPTPQMKLSFTQRVEEKSEYVSIPAEQSKFLPWFNYSFGYGEISPVYIAHLENILPAWRQYLEKKGLLRDEVFRLEDLEVTPEKISYKEITAGKVIFCDGYLGAANPYFSLLPFAPNKGEVLVVEIPGIPAHHIFKKGMMLVPLESPGLWWVGSSYAWKFDDPGPTTEFREKTAALLMEWLKSPFKILDHLAAVRPATLERRPFAGFHPLFPNIGLLNGMGTKGCSLAPFFARQLADHLCYGKTLNPEADIMRFRKILSRMRPR